MNPPPPSMPDPMKLSRMIRLLNDYVHEGLIGAPERPFKMMTEGELEDLIEVARVRREERENPEPTSQPEAEEEGEGEGEAQPQPAQPEPAPEEPQPEGSTVSEGGISEQEFKDLYPKGTRIEYGGTEFVITKHSKPGAEGVPHMTGVLIGDEEEFTLDEHNDGMIQAAGQPTKIPQKVEYPPQVFLVSKVVEGVSVASIYLDHGTLLAEHPDIDGDAIMEAISDPGEPQGIEGGTVVYTSIG